MEKEIKKLELIKFGTKEVSDLEVIAEKLNELIEAFNNK